MQRTEALLEEQRAHSQTLGEQLDQLEAEKEVSLQNERQTISFLVSEKSSLTAELERLEGVEARKSLKACGLMVSNVQQKPTSLRSLLQGSVKIQGILTNMFIDYKAKSKKLRCVHKHLRQRRKS